MPPDGGTTIDTRPYGVRPPLATRVIGKFVAPNGTLTVWLWAFRLEVPTLIRTTPMSVNWLRSVARKVKVSSPMNDLACSGLGWQRSPRRCRWAAMVYSTKV